MIAVALAGILSVVALNSFKNITKSSSIQGEISEFRSMVEFSRGEAIREGSTVSMCVSNNSTSSSPSCTGGTSWDQGFIVFSDANGNGSYGSGDTLLRKVPAFSSKDTLTASNSMSYFVFNRLGFINNISGNTTVMLTGHASTASSASTQCISVGVVGLLTNVPYNGGTCT